MGDPLTRPSRRDFTVTVGDLATGMTVTGDVAVDVRTASRDGVAAAGHELDVDGRLAAACRAAETLRRGG